MFIEKIKEQIMKKYKYVVTYTLQNQYLEEIVCQAANWFELNTIIDRLLPSSATIISIHIKQE